jgi:ribonuclease III
LLRRIFSFPKRQIRSIEEINLIRFIIKNFGYRPKNINFFLEAFIHRSTSGQKGVQISNERLEFLGDTVLDLIVADYLFIKFPNKDEGFLTQLKSKIVSRKTLSEIGEKLELRKLIKYQKGRNINLSSLEGNAFEAIIGAIYLDGGFESAQKSIINNVFRNYLDESKIFLEEIDFKSKLFIFCQKNQLFLNFQVVHEENVNGNKKYEILVLLNDIEYGKGKGFSKKEAEQEASKITLEKLGEI